MPEEQVPPTPATPEPEPAPAAEPVAAAPAEPQWNARENFERLERMLTTMAQQMQPKPVEPVKGPNDISDQELWALAQQGNQEAFIEHQRRISRKEHQAQFGAFQREQAAAQQLQMLAQIHPEFNDNSSPVMQKTQAVRQALLNMGYPNNNQTLLDAATKAVAFTAKDAPAPRLASPRGTPSHIAPSHAQPAPTSRQETVTPAEHAMAKRMGVKDPSRAKANFNKRQAEGLSSVSPTIITALDYEERQGNVR